MATLALSLAGQVVGGALGGPIGATIGRALGALAGNAIDSQIFGDATPQPAGADVRLQGSSEGAPIPKLYGWSRLSGNIIWATELEQLSSTTSGAKTTQPAGDPGVAANFAVAFCEGEVQRLGRVWADGRLLDTSGITLRFYRGTETQDADSLIEAKQGEDAPAYRGTCYVVFERLPLTPFGNRIPNISVELCRVVGELEPMIRAVTVIPGATEFGYDPVARVRIASPGVTVSENAHQSPTVSDWTLSIDELCALCPNLKSVSLVVAWFGDDLRCGSCAVAPRVEAASRTVQGTVWGVAGLGRDDVAVVSNHDGGPAYGGTPSDAAVRAAIADLKARGLKVTLYPMLLMDIPTGNPLGQPTYPWRGRIACLPASDGTGAADTEVAAFVGQYGDFIRHYAQLGVDAGGIDAILLGSEMRGMTTTRGATGFPFVDALVSLAADVRAIVGPDTAITYGADWSEYSGVQSGGGEKLFHLDPLWASADIDAVGVDNYMPLSDWRDGGGPDAADWDGPYDLGYLRSNIAGGEGFDWYYASDADRLSGTRSPITDGAYGEPWVWRTKDLAGWWSNAHHDRPGGVRNASPTDWVPGSKPIWFTELGCGAVDKGANQPNVFTDPKSAESAKPYFSSGIPDTLAQRQALRAVLGYWSDDANNPAASLYAGRMVEDIALWTWDARPYPAFPVQGEVWSDGANYPTGHWLTGRLGGFASDELADAIAADFGVTLAAGPARPPFGLGYVVDRPMSARDALAPLLDAAGVDVRDAPAGLAIVAASSRDPVTIDDVVADDGPRISRRRPDPGEAVGQLVLGYADRERDYLNGVATAILPEAGPLVTIDAALVLDLGAARATAERRLRDLTAERDTATFTAPPSRLALEAGDAVALGGDTFEIVEVRDGLARRITAQAVVPSDLPVATSATRPGQGSALTPAAAPELVAAELPPDPADPGRAQLALASFAQPWPGEIAVTDDGTGARVATLSRAGAIGVLASPIPAASIYLWDDITTIDVVLYSGHLSSRDDDEVLGGANRIAAETDAGGWEVIGFANASLIAPQTYRLTRLLRGQMGTDFAIGPTSSGNPVLVLDDDATLLPVPPAWMGATATLRWYAGAADPTGTVDVVDTSLDPLLPLAPVHLCAKRAAGSSDIALSWVRRSRADTDSWVPDDAPLDQSPEAYRLTIFSGLTAVRTVDTSASSATYTTAQQTADFGSPPSSFTYTVAQKSPLYGPGHAAAATFTA